MPTPESTKTKVVQTELDEDAYERLRRVAEQEETSIKGVLRDAVSEYVRHHIRYEPEDPLFSATPGTGDQETDAAETDVYLADAIDDGRD